MQALAKIITSKIVLGPGVTFAGHKVTLSKDGVDGEPLTTTDTEVTFDDLAPGTYVVSVVSIDTNGNAMAAVCVSEPVVVPVVEEPSADVASSITLSLV